MKPGFSKLFTLTLVLTFSSLVALAQVPTSTLSGSVLDQSGAVVANATITVKNNGTGAESKTTSSRNGTFAVPQLPVGIYTVTISATGFKQVVVQDVKIDAATAASLNQTLEVGQQSESVVVQGGADILQTQSANISTTIAWKADHRASLYLTRRSGPRPPPAGHIDSRATTHLYRKWLAQGCDQHHDGRRQRPGQYAEIIRRFLHLHPSQD